MNAGILRVQDRRELITKPSTIRHTLRRISVSTVGFLAGRAGGGLFSADKPDTSAVAHRNGLAKLFLFVPVLLAGCMVGPVRTLGPDQEPQPALWPSTAAQTLKAPFAPRRVALVLSGGGLRGLAHLGVLRVLEQQGLRPDLIVGTSVGAVMGGAYASGTPVKDLEALPLPNTLNPWGSWLVTPRQRSAALEQFVASQLAHQRMEDFPVRFVAVATERQSGCVMLFGSGDAARAIMASSALPGALAPVAINGGVYVDGGLGAPLPVRIARALGADLVIAVDTTYHAEPVVPDGLIDSVFHAGMVMARNLAAADRQTADLVLDPRLPPVPEVSLRNSKSLVDAGELAALQQLPQLRMLFATGPRALKRPIGWQVAPAPMCSPAAGATPGGVAPDHPADDEAAHATGRIDQIAGRNAFGR